VADPTPAPPTNPFREIRTENREHLPLTPMLINGVTLCKGELDVTTRPISCQVTVWHDSAVTMPWSLRPDMQSR